MDKLARYFIGLVVTLAIMLVAFFVISAVVAKVQNTTLFKLFQLAPEIGTLLLAVKL